MDGVTGGHFGGNGGPWSSYPHHGKHFVAWNFNVSGGPSNYNFWPNEPRNGHTFTSPIFAGLQGKAISMSGEEINELPGQAVEPASLFEAQLALRLAETYATWATSNISDPAMANFDQDPDGDGLTNGTEAYFGTNPNNHDNLPQISGTFDNNNLTIAHPINPNLPNDIQATYEWSLDIENWYPSGAGPVGGPTVTFNSTENNNSISVSAASTSSNQKFFFRIRVTQQ